MRTTLLLLCIWTGMLPSLLGQSNTQTIRGRITDLRTRLPVSGATVQVLGVDPVLGAISGENGRFVIRDVPVGRRSIRVRMAGYLTYRSEDFILNAAREGLVEVVLEEGLEETTVDSVMIMARTFPTEAVNPLSFVSTRSFSVDETERYAASVNDPGRMALSFPGVQQGADDNENDIIIRGNSSFGMLWRLEGMDIPNPNHFARPGTSGGGITVFSAQLLDRSDFSTGGMPADYGNAISGAMDMHFRKGNDQKKEHRIQLGLLGLDLATEGPIRQGRSSYLANYRLSTLGILNRLGFELVGERVDNDFTDLSFNVVSESEDGRSTVSVFGIGGLSEEHYRPVEEGEERDTGKADHWEDRIQGSNMATIGLTYTRLLDEKSYLKWVVAGMHSNIYRRFDTLDLADTRFRYNTEKYQDRRISTSLQYSRMLHVNTQLKTGLIMHQIFFDFFKESVSRNASSDITGLGNQALSIDGDGSTQTMQAYLSLSQKVGTDIRINGGFHILRLNLNGTTAIDPRISVKYQVTPRQSLSFAYGLHSQILPLGAYFYTEKDTAIDGSISLLNPNKELDMIRSHHVIMGWNTNLGKSLRLGAEIYLQRLFQVPVRANFLDTDTWWMLNNQSGIAQFPLQSAGKGLNYGLDLVLEKYFSNQVFFLLTASRYESTYELPDGRSFNTRYATTYTSSITSGKEFVFKKGGVLQVGARVMYNGGFRYTPANVSQSVDEGRFVADETQAWEEQVGPYFRIDARFAYRKNKPGFASTLSLDIQNVSDRRSPRGVAWDSERNEIFFRTHNSGLIPVLSYQVDF